MRRKGQAKVVGQAVLWGIFSLVLYLIVFLNQQTVTEIFTRGGFYAVPVILTALFFSFVHGVFANYFIEAMGFKPVSKGGR
ncbi:MAG: hypothetical protein ACOY40_17595 [Bacillota bacterium]